MKKIRGFKGPVEIARTKQGKAVVVFEMTCHKGEMLFDVWVLDAATETEGGKETFPDFESALHVYEKVVGGKQK